MARGKARFKAVLDNKKNAGKGDDIWRHGERLGPEQWREGGSPSRINSGETHRVTRITRAPLSPCAGAQQRRTLPSAVSTAARLARVEASGRRAANPGSQRSPLGSCRLWLEHSEQKLIFRKLLCPRTAACWSRGAQRRDRSQKTSFKRPLGAASLSVRRGGS